MSYFSPTNNSNAFSVGVSQTQSSSARRRPQQRLSAVATEPLQFLSGSQQQQSSQRSPSSAKFSQASPSTSQAANAVAKAVTGSLPSSSVSKASSLPIPSSCKDVVDQLLDAADISSGKNKIVDAAKFSVLKVEQQSLQTQLTSSAARSQKEWLRVLSDVATKLFPDSCDKKSKFLKYCYRFFDKKNPDSKPDLKSESQQHQSSQRSPSSALQSQQERFLLDAVAKLFPDSPDRKSEFLKYCYRFFDKRNPDSKSLAMLSKDSSSTSQVDAVAKAATGSLPSSSASQISSLPIPSSAPQSQQEWSLVLSDAAARLFSDSQSEMSGFLKYCSCLFGRDFFGWGLLKDLTEIEGSIRDGTIFKIFSRELLEGNKRYFYSRDQKQLIEDQFIELRHMMFAVFKTLYMRRGVPNYPPDKTFVSKLVNVIGAQNIYDETDCSFKETRYMIDIAAFKTLVDEFISDEQKRLSQSLSIPPAHSASSAAAPMSGKGATDKKE